jgi:hypothetical protein
LARGYHKSPDDLLSGIDQIRWDLLQHAYGAATDVPDCLCILAYGNEAQREDIQCELESNIFHQGTTYSATPFAVPFLIRMISTTWVHDRIWISKYLKTLASCSGGQICIDDVVSPSVLDAVSAGTPVYRTTLETAEPLLKSSLELLLAACTNASLPHDWWVLRKEYKNK